LRGLREAGTLMAIPVYLFLASYLTMLAVGVVRATLGEPGSFEAAAPRATEPLTAWLVLHALASGCTALTGIEAISNGVPVFRAPEPKNATRTLGVMALLMGTLFLGSIGLTHYFAVVARPDETILSALVRRVLGDNLLYVAVQAATFLILTVAANTSFAGFPRLASILAKDGYAPRQLSFLGDRLVFANGILLLAGLTALLIVVFNGDTHALIPLFAVGVFLAFTLSQAGMVIHWLRVRGPAWRLKTAINGLGALATAAALGVILISKFVDGAWLVVLLIPLLLASFRTVNEHYREVARELTLRGASPNLDPLRPPQIVLPISGVHRAVVEALRYARTISDRVTAVYVEVSPGDAERIRREWETWGQGVPLVVLPSPYRSVIGPFLEYLDQLDADRGDDQLAWVLLPEFVPAHWWQHLLHNQTAWAIKLALLYRRRRLDKVRVIIDIPWHLRK
jgi:hypothetical protein